jgi:hypothetical protein
MSPQRRVTAWKRDRRTGALRGDDDAIYNALKAADATSVYRWSPIEQAYLVTLGRFDAVLVALEQNGWIVDYQAALW